MKCHAAPCLFIVCLHLVLVLVTDIMVSTSSHAQTPEPDLSPYVEDVIFDPDEDFDPESMNETLMSLYHRPIDLNSPDRKDFQAIPFLTEFEISAILSFREESGPFLSCYELYLIEDLDSARTDMLLPFVKVSHEYNRRDTLSLFRNLFRTSHKSLILRYGRSLQQQKGYINRKQGFSIDESLYYLGSQDYIYGRLEIHQPEDFDVGLTFEKDPGEAFFFNRSLSSYGFDHYAGYLRLLNRGLLRECIIGNFQLHYGEGLVLGRGYNRKGTETIGAIRNRYSGLHPYQGASESGSFRGTALELGDRRMNATIFLSANSVDALVGQDTIESHVASKYITNIHSDGLHRTPLELRAKRAVTEYAVGYNLQYHGSLLPVSFGTTLALMYRNLPLKTAPTYYNAFRFAGSRNLAGSFYYNFCRGKFNIFGEIAISSGYEKAVVQGIMANLLANFEASVHVRYFSRGYYSEYGKSFSEYSGNNNEAGIYWGFLMKPVARTELRAYFDIFRTMWFRYNMAGPANGNEIFLELRYHPRTSLYLTTAFKRECKGRNNLMANMPMRVIGEGIKMNLNVSLATEASDRLRLKTRLQGSTFNFSGILTRGFCLSQDMGYGARKIKLNARVAYFATDDFFNRQYMYEHDMLYAFQLPAYYGHGMRAYLLLKYSPADTLDLWLKVSQYHYFDRDEIGSGLSRIQGNKKTEIKCQIRIKF